MRDKSPKNAPQNLLLLKRIYKNICPPSEYKPLFPDGRGRIDEPLDFHNTGEMKAQKKSPAAKLARATQISLATRVVGNDIYATDSSSESSDQ